VFLKDRSAIGFRATVKGASVLSGCAIQNDMPQRSTELVKDPAFIAAIVLAISVVCLFLGIHYGRWTVVAASFAIGLSVVIALTQIVFGRAHNQSAMRT